MCCSTLTGRDFGHRDMTPASTQCICYVQVCGFAEKDGCEHWVGSSVCWVGRVADNRGSPLESRVCHVYSVCALVVSAASDGAHAQRLCALVGLGNGKGGGPCTIHVCGGCCWRYWAVAINA